MVAVPLTPALKRQRQAALYEFEASLDCQGYTEKRCHENQKKPNQTKSLLLIT